MMRKIIILLFIISLKLFYSCQNGNNINNMEVKNNNDSLVYWSDLIINEKSANTVSDSIFFVINSVDKYSIPSDLIPCRLISDTIYFSPILSGYVNNKTILDYELIIVITQNKYKMKLVSYNTVKAFHRKDTIPFNIISSSLILNRNKYVLLDSITMNIKCNGVSYIGDTVEVIGNVQVKLRDSLSNFGTLLYEKRLKNSKY